VEKKIDEISVWISLLLAEIKTSGVKGDSLAELSGRTWNVFHKNEG